MTPATSSVWIVDDDRSIRWVLEKSLQQAGMETRLFETADAAAAALKTEQPDALLCDIRMPGTDGLVFLQDVHLRHPSLPVIIMTAHSDLDSAVAAYQGGAFEYLPKPFDIDEAIAVTRRALDHRLAQASGASAKVPDAPDGVEQDIIGEAPAMQEVFRAIGRLSQSNITVLINGESGSGKELVARALYRHSPRRNKPFIALNMAAIPRDLIESELFGHEKGAFTGATAQRSGRFEQANNGTLFLDEIGDMPAETQTRLLRVLSAGEFYRVGGTVPVKVDVRIIAATHQKLEKLVEQNRFREDLFHRLNVIRIHLPRLADRREDIPRLAHYFLARAARELGGETKNLTVDAEQYMRTLDWPGNVRQLENICRWLTVMAAGRDIHVSDFPPELRQQSRQEPMEAGSWTQLLRRWADRELAVGQGALLDKALPEFEKVMIEAALAHTAGRRGDAANQLGWGRNTLTRKISELGMFIAEEDDKD